MTGVEDPFQRSLSVQEIFFVLGRCQLYSRGIMTDKIKTKALPSLTMEDGRRSIEQTTDSRWVTANN